MIQASSQSAIELLTKENTDLRNKLQNLTELARAQEILIQNVNSEPTPQVDQVTSQKFIKLVSSFMTFKSIGFFVFR